ncbi:putative ubiquitin-conjugating enzyme E2 [Mycena sp. CBHHK59/15]|nr:putative ubiquitin-conjugating enzyme E2 [Mycena sp. CBHHK59/15]
MEHEEERGRGSEKEAKDQRAQIRVQKGSYSRPRPSEPPVLIETLDLTELDLPSTMKTNFPDPADLLNFSLTITPDEGWRVCFLFRINTNYPHDPPKVKCTQTIYHPNVDLEGNVCLNILREDWKPVLNLNSVMVGLQYLFLEPNADDPLNKGACFQLSAAIEMSKNREQFLVNVKSSMRGHNIKGVQYASVLVR